MIGVFDSGVGGLSVLREIRALLPRERVDYVADSAYVPYGTRAPQAIRDRSMVIVRFLVEERAARVVVVACNTATTHAVDLVRREFPAVSIVGMEPAIKPAARATKTGVVGILATGATLAGERVASLIERHAEGITVVTQPCPGLVEQVERGDLSGPRTIELIERYTAPMLEHHADTIVLGCTHYPFLRGAIAGVVGPSVMVIDSGAAVARRTASVCAGPVSRDEGPVTFFTSGDPRAVLPVMTRLWGESIDEVRRLPASAG